MIPAQNLPATPAPRSSRAPIRAAVVVAVEHGEVLVTETESPAVVVRARVVDLGGRVLAVGDAVLVADTSDGRFVLGALGAGTTRRELADGSVVETDAERVTVRGPDGLVRVRYEGGSAEVAAATGDLTLAAPSGRVLLCAGSDVEITAARRVAAGVAGAETPALTIDAGVARLHAPAVEIEAKSHRVLAEESSTVARTITQTAEVLASSAERFELRATRIVEKARDAIREIADLAETRAGRMRTIVRGALTSHARVTAIQSKEETSVDGSTVYLG